MRILSWAPSEPAVLPACTPKHVSIAAQQSLVSCSLISLQGCSPVASSDALLQTARHHALASYCIWALHLLLHVLGQQGCAATQFPAPATWCGNLA